MTYTNFTIKNNDEIDVFVHKWSLQKVPIKGIMCFIHGMSEHGLRYEHFSKMLNKEGYVCYVMDIRGHGKSMSNPETPGWLGEEGVDGVIQDQNQLVDVIRSDYPDKPLFLFGHSWGSYIAQDFIQNHGDKVQGVILSGTKGKQDMLGLSVIIGKFVLAFKGKKAEAGLFHKLGVQYANKPFEPAKSSCAWICSIDEVVKMYDADPLCGFKPVNAFFTESSKLMKSIWNAKNEANIPKNLPIFVVGGALDGYNFAFKEADILVKRYRKIGLTKVTSKAYENNRHEVHNDISQAELYADVIAFLNQHSK